MILKNAKVLNEQFKFEKTDIKISGETIEKIGTINQEGLDFENCYILPGLIDSHLHAAMGQTFLEYHPETFETIAKYEAQNGTTTIAPALSAAKTEKMVDCLNYMKKFVGVLQDGCAEMAGIHLEGPFFSEKYRGAHLPENIRHPSVNELDVLMNAADNTVKILTLAPELPNAEEVVRHAVNSGLVVSAGHTDATAEVIEKSYGWGVRQGTHLYNAMRPLNHREAGTVGGLLYGDFRCELIADFVHVHPKVLALTYRTIGADRINLITDAEIATGMPNGEYVINGRKYLKIDGKTLTDDGAIAGGSACLLDCVKNMTKLGVPLEQACKMASYNPAKTLGIEDKKGSIAENKTADLIILDKNLNLKQVILRGKMLEKS